MNTKNNRRKQSSIQKIQQTFMTLLQSKELSQITVAELCKASNLNRGTFYCHYTDIYDLAQHLCRELELDVYQLLVLESGWHQSQEDFHKLFCHIRDNQNLYRFYFKLGQERTELNWQDIADLSALSSSNIDYHLTFFRNGFNALVRLWLQRGCPETPEQMCQILANEYSGRFT